MRVVLAAGFAAALAGCSVGGQVAPPKPAELEPETSDGAAATEAPGPVIVTIQSHKGRVTVYSSDVGPLFTITDNDGVVEAEALTFVELQDRYPDYYRALRNSIAADGRMYAGYDRVTPDGKPARVIDAEADAPVIAPEAPAESAVPGTGIRIRTLDASER